MFGGVIPSRIGDCNAAFPGQGRFVRSPLAIWHIAGFSRCDDPNRPARSFACRHDADGDRLWCDGREPVLCTNADRTDRPRYRPVRRACRGNRDVDAAGIWAGPRLHRAAVGSGREQAPDPDLDRRGGARFAWHRAGAGPGDVSCRRADDGCLLGRGTGARPPCGEAQQPGAAGAHDRAGDERPADRNHARATGCQFRRRVGPGGARCSSFPPESPRWSGSRC